MEDEKSGVVSTEVEDETEKTDVLITRPHATLDWLSGYAAGERRGVADAVDALSIVLREAGVSDDEAGVISQKILERSGLQHLFE